MGRQGKGRGREGGKEGRGLCASDSDPCFTTRIRRLTARGKAELKDYVSEHSQAFYEAVRRERGREGGQEGGKEGRMRVRQKSLSSYLEGGRGKEGGGVLVQAGSLLFGSESSAYFPSA